MNTTALAQAPAAPNKQWLKKAAIAERYGVSERTIQTWMDEGTLPFRKIGYMVRFDPEECDRALDRFRQNPPDEE